MGKNLFGKFDGCGSHRNGILADGSVGTHFFGNGKRFLKQCVEVGIDAFLLLCDTHSIFNLSQNLRLAQYHRIQSAGNAESVADGFVVVQGIKIGADFFGGQVVVLRQPFDDLLGFADAVKLGAVAGR